MKDNKWMIFIKNAGVTPRIFRALPFHQAALGSMAALLLLTASDLHAVLWLGNSNTNNGSNTCPQTFAGQSGTDAAFWNAAQRYGTVTNGLQSPFNFTNGATSGGQCYSFPGGMTDPLAIALFEPQLQTNRGDVTFTTDFQFPTAMSSGQFADFLLFGNEGASTNVFGPWLRFTQNGSNIELTAKGTSSVVVASAIVPGSAATNWYRMQVTLPATPIPLGPPVVPNATYKVTLTQYNVGTVNNPTTLYNFDAAPTDIRGLQVDAENTTMNVDNIGVSDNPFGHFTVNRGAWANKMPDAAWDRGFIILSHIVTNSSPDGFGWDSTFVPPVSQGVEGSYYGSNCYALMPTNRNWILGFGPPLPSWLTNGNGGYALQPNDYGQYQAMIKWVIKNLPAQVKVIEPANEMGWWQGSGNPQCGWQDAQHMADYLSHTSQAKNVSARPDLILAGPTWVSPAPFAVTNFNTLASTISQGSNTFDWMDALSMHDYDYAGSGFTIYQQLNAWMSDLQSWYVNLNTNGFGSMPHYWTEFGWSVNLLANHPYVLVTMDQQAAFDACGYAAIKAHNASGVMGYAVSDQNSDFGYMNQMVIAGQTNLIPRPSYYSSAFVMSWLKDSGSAAITTNSAGTFYKLDFGDRVVMWDTAYTNGATYSTNAGFPIVSAKDMCGANTAFSGSNAFISYHPVFLAKNAGITNNIQCATFDDPALLGSTDPTTNDPAFWNVLTRDKGLVTTNYFSPSAGATSGQSFMISNTSAYPAALYQAGFTPQLQSARTDLTVAMDFMIPSATISSLTAASIAVINSSGTTNGPVIKFTPTGASNFYVIAEQSSNQTITTLSADTWYRMTVTMPAASLTNYNVAIGPVNLAATNYPTSYIFQGSPANLSTLSVAVQGTGASLYLDNIAIQSANP